MSQVAAVVEPLDFELVTDDGAPLESPVHFLQIALTLDLIRYVMTERGRAEDYYAGGNMFVYYSPKQARKVAEEEGFVVPADDDSEKDSAFRGPDAFFVGGVTNHPREAWVVWEEGERFPDVIFEFLSKSTAYLDKGKKKTLYAKTFRTSEYFLWDPPRRREGKPPRAATLTGYRLLDHDYQELRKNDREWLWSRELELYLGLWDGVYRGESSTWLRFFYPDGRMVPVPEEIAEQERERAEQASHRAEQASHRAEQASHRAERAEQENARLRALLAQLTGSAP